MQRVEGCGFGVAESLLQGAPQRPGAQASHTQLVGKLGVLEKWINTPALHRVHHGINPRYLDKNFGGTFVVWDRVFGTYEPETDPVVYGLVKPLRSFNPFTAQFHYWPDLWKRARATPRLADKVRVLIKGPLYTPPGMEPFPPPPDVHPETFRKYDVPLQAALARYVLVQLALVVLGTTGLMFLETTLPKWQLALGALIVFMALLAFGGFLERGRWALAVERARLVILAFGAVALAWRGPVPPVAAVACVALAAAMWIWLQRVARAPASTRPAASVRTV